MLYLRSRTVPILALLSSLGYAGVMYFIAVSVVFDHFDCNPFCNNDTELTNAFPLSSYFALSIALGIGLFAIALAGLKKLNLVAALSVQSAFMLGFLCHLLLANLLLLEGESLEEEGLMTLLIWTLFGAPFLVGLGIILANAKFGWVRPPKSSSNFLRTKESAKSGWELALGIVACLISAVVWVLVIKLWVEPDLVRGERFESDLAEWWGLFSFLHLANGFLWLYQVIPFPKIGRLTVLVAQAIQGLLLFLASFVTVMDAPGLFFLTQALILFWIVVGLYYLGPLAGVDVRFLPWQRRGSGE